MKLENVVLHLHQIKFTCSRKKERKKERKGRKEGKKEKEGNERAGLTGAGRVGRSAGVLPLGNVRPRVQSTVGSDTCGCRVFWEGAC